ncbi:MAG: hypothetical protein N4A64_03775 [Marinisporobacter sp.]|jgi:hypothetical protein|nr:hypothetical protein [Marinisporobacter sp.]
MKNQKIVDCIIQKKFKEVLTANKQGKLYDFRKELKKELEITLEKVHNHNQKKEIEIILNEIKNDHTHIDWMH